MKILFAIWGNPAAWKAIKYKYEDFEITSNSSLKILIEKIKPTKTIVIGSDTLISSEELKCLENYEQLKQKVINKYNNYFDKWELKIDSLILGYGKGKFRDKSDNILFDGNARDFYHIVNYEIMKVLDNLIEENKESDIEIYLDITHGINFMTVLTYKIINEFAQILAYFYNVKLEVLNADPYFDGIDSELSINVISSLKIRPYFFVYNPERKYLKPFEGINNEEEKILKNEVKEILSSYNEDNIYCFASALIYGLPYFVYYFYPNPDELIKIIDDIAHLHFNKIALNNKDMYVVRKLQFDQKFSELVKTYLISKLLKTKLEMQSGRDDILLNDIDKLYKDIWANLSVDGIRIKKELEKIEELLLKKIKDEKGNEIYLLKNEWQKYSEILNSINKSNDKNKKINDRFDERNFFAHAGFEQNVLYLKKENDKIKLKFVEELKQDVVKALKKYLQKGATL